MITKAGAVYNKAVAIGTVAKSIVLNMLKLKNTILNIPVPIKYPRWLNLCIFKLFLDAINKKGNKIMEVKKTRKVTTSIGVKPISYKFFTYILIVPQSEAPINT